MEKSIKQVISISKKFLFYLLRAEFHLTDKHNILYEKHKIKQETLKAMNIKHLHTDPMGSISSQPAEEHLNAALTVIAQEWSTQS